MYVFCELLKAVSAATYSALKAVALDPDKLSFADDANPLIASLWVCAEADRPAVPPPASNDTILVFNAPLNAESPATYSLLSAVAVEELKLLFAVVCAPSRATYSALNAVAVDDDKELLAEVASPFIASLWVWADDDSVVLADVWAASNWFLLVSAAPLNADNSASVANEASNDPVKVSRAPNLASAADFWASLWVDADPDSAATDATYSDLRAVAVDDDKFVFAVVWAVFNAALCVWADAETASVMSSLESTDAEKAPPSAK